MPDIAVKPRHHRGVRLLRGRPRSVAVLAEVVDLEAAVRKRDGVEEEERPVALRAHPLEHLALDQVLRVDRPDALTVVAGQLDAPIVAVKIGRAHV